jgi:hypothetical protein
MKLLNGVLDGVLGVLPSRLSCFGAGEDAVNQPYAGGGSPPFVNPDYQPVDMTELQNVLQPAQQPVDMSALQSILQPTTTSYLSPEPAPYTYAGPDSGMKSSSAARCSEARS